MGTEQGHLLIVDSNKAQCDILAHHLERWGYTVNIAKDKQQALEKLTPGKIEAPHFQKVDLLILGSAIPETDICQLLEQLNRDPSPLVIVTSAGNDLDRIAKYIELGVEDYLPEIFNPVLLNARISGCLEKKRLRIQAQAHLGLLKLEHDMQIGRKIQADFLPHQNTLPQPPGWDIAASFHPARQVSGDFFDAFPVGRSKVGLVIADVCDKGVGPALFMALIRSLLRAFAEQHRPLNWLDSFTEEQSSSDAKKSIKRQRMLLSSGTTALLAVELTNKYVCENHGDMNMFATLFFGVLDPATGVLTYINGGHDSPAIIGSNGEVKARLFPTGPAVGILPDTDFDIEQVTLEPADLLMMFTDGTTDALNSSEEPFSEQRLLSLLQQPVPSVTVLLDRIVASLRTHIADTEQFDDITLLAVRRKPASKKRQPRNAEKSGQPYTDNLFDLLQEELDDLEQQETFTSVDLLDLPPALANLIGEIMYRNGMSLTEIAAELRQTSRTTKEFLDKLIEKGYLCQVNVKQEVLYKTNFRRKAKKPSGRDKLWSTLDSIIIDEEEG